MEHQLAGGEESPVDPAGGGGGGEEDSTSVGRRNSTTMRRGKIPQMGLDEITKLGRGNFQQMKCWKYSNITGNLVC